LTRRDNQNFRLRAPFFAAINTTARHQILIQIVALFSSKLSRCTNGQICQRQRQAVEIRALEYFGDITIDRVTEATVISITCLVRRTAESERQAANNRDSCLSGYIQNQEIELGLRSRSRTLSAKRSFNRAFEAICCNLIVTSMVGKGSLLAVPLAIGPYRTERLRAG
jgi:hypothetical protein